MARSDRQARMPAPITWHADRDEPDNHAAAAAIAAAASLVAMWPYTSVIAPGSWSFAVLSVIVVTAIAGFGTRLLLRYRSRWARELVTLGVQVAATTGALTQLVAGDTAILGVVPTPTTVLAFQTLSASAWEEIAFGTAPLEATPGLRAVLGLGFAVVAILIDQLVATRGAVLAAILTAVIGSVPMIVTLGEANVVWFVLLGGVLLLLFRFTARRHPEAPRRSSAALASGVGIAAMLAAVVVAPALPVSASLTGTGVGVTVDASLRLGDDLRQPNPVEVLTVATAEDTAPYLRLTTLSQFDGRVWRPDRGELQEQSEGFGPDEWGADIATSEESTSIRVVRMSSSWLPVPYPATGIQGVTATWRLSPENRTVVSRSADAVGSDYTVASLEVTPTLEQIRAIEVAAPLADPDADPVELPAVIASTAAEVTAQAETDYDRLIALQSWFRNGFRYSLDTPVEEGFDGTGAEAVARFLEARSGYCVHFAGAFALMAESLGMQVRIVVGYLPGTITEERRGDDNVFSVSSDQLHSWPEVLFPGVGWVPFEPTASLGVPTAFAASTATGGPGGAPVTPVPTSTPGAEQTTGPEIDRGDDTGDAGAGAPLRRLDPAPVLLATLGTLFVLALPAVIRILVRARRRGRARRGDAGAAWTELRATMLDLELPVSDADSPRSRGALLVTEGRADADAMRALTDAVERANYARTGGDAGDLTAALDGVLRELRRSVDRPTRLRALLLPRSLFAGRGADAPLLA
ncbi:transglutaminaseTgpA domain-containing protein [Microbacterium hydrocarbonoxydans]|uniref:transglutaminase family protein n=1 Tax=Microbacterium hydrocarbonoxydans TaxID=273678 RepID=UPI0007BBC82C|nr:DUF3488 and transglutaminase-like domain-containing protein [Microbacterium hydrocarbonoxydans]GAT73889.1 transglutaminase domain-containing protein [Microbacterium sp. HM58-2]